MSSPSNNIKINIYDQLTPEKKSKFDCFKEIFSDHDDQQCLDILESNLWSIEASIDSLTQQTNSFKHQGGNVALEGITLENHQYLPIASIPPLSMTASPQICTSDAVTTTNLTKTLMLPKSVTNEIQMSPFIERVYYQPLISQQSHPWIIKFVNLLYSPIYVTSHIFNIFLKYLFFRKNEDSNTIMLAKYETELLENLSSSLIPDSQTGAVSLFLGTFEAAVAQAKHDYKFLVVYLHKLADRDAQYFLHYSLLNEEVIKLLNDPENLLIWPASLTGREGMAVSNHLYQNDHDSSSPSSSILLAFMTITATSPGSAPKLSVIGQLETPVSAKDLKEWLIKWKEVGSRPRLVAKRDRETRNAVTSLRRTQEVLYDEMLAKDVQRERNKQLERDEQSAVGERKSDLRYKLSQMMEGYIANEINGGSGSSSGRLRIETKLVKLLIRMHNGRRFQWIFYSDDSVKYLYYLVYSQEDAPLKFHLLWGYPQKVLQHCPISLETHEIHTEPTNNDPPSFNALNLIGNQTVLVRDIDV